MADETKRPNDPVVIEGKTVQIKGKTTIESVEELGGVSGAIVLNANDVVFANKTGARKPSRTAAAKNIALSSAAGEKLVINRTGGFGGGVVIEGEVSLPGTATAAQLAAQEVSAKVLKGWGKTDKLDVECKTTFKDTVELAKGVTCTGSITVESSGTKKGELVIKSNAILVDVPRRSTPLDLVAELIDLRRDFEALKDKVARLD